MQAAPNWQWFDTSLPGGFTSAFEEATGAIGAGFSFPFEIDSSGNYVWNSTSGGAQTISGIDASKQFPPGGFIGPSGAAAWGLIPGEGSTLGGWLETIFPSPNGRAPKTGGVMESTSGPAANIPVAWWVVGAIVLLLLLRR